MEKEVTSNFLIGPGSVILGELYHRYQGKCRTSTLLNVLARESHLPKKEIEPYLQRLEKAGLLKRDSDFYVLTEQGNELSNSLVSSMPSLVAG